MRGGAAGKTYRDLVREAWRALGVERHDDRSFLEAVRDTVAERDRLRLEVEELRCARSAASVTS